MFSPEMFARAEVAKGLLAPDGNSLPRRKYVLRQFEDPSRRLAAGSDVVNGIFKPEMRRPFFTTDKRKAKIEICPDPDFFRKQQIAYPGFAIWIEAMVIERLHMALFQQRAAPMPDYPVGVPILTPPAAHEIHDNIRIVFANVINVVCDTFPYVK